MPRRTVVLILAAIAGLLVGTAGAQPRASVSPTRVAADPNTDRDAEHRSLVEFDTIADGDRILATYQAGRFAAGGGAAAIGWSFSDDAGGTWVSGTLAGITAADGGTFDRVTDPVAAYDAVRAVWLIQSLAFSNGVAAVLVSRSTDGVTWSEVTITEFTGGDDVDKNWIACDRWPQSTYYGNCYGMVRLDRGRGVEIVLNTSSDGGLTWTAPVAPAAAVDGFAQIVVRPDGRVVVVYDDVVRGGIRSFVSDNGGASYGRSRLVTAPRRNGHPQAAVRGPSLVSATVDGRGHVLVLSTACVFRPTCSGDDLVLAVSRDGREWEPLRRIPVGGVRTPQGMLGGGIDADPATSGRRGAIGVHFYALADARCLATDCRVRAGFVSSRDGGRTWSAPTWIGGAHRLNGYPEVISGSTGFMIGDYLSTSVVNGQAHSVFGLARPPRNGLLRVGGYVVPGGLPVTGGVRRAPSLTFPPSARSGLRSSSTR